MARGKALPSRESVDLDPDYEELMVTIGTAVLEIEQQVPGPLFFFEDYNCPGMVYIATIAHFRGLAREGGDPHSVNPRRIDRGGVIDCGQEGFVTALPAQTTGPVKRRTTPRLNTGGWPSCFLDR